MATSRLDPTCPDCGGARCDSDWHLDVDRPAPLSDRTRVWLAILCGSFLGVFLVLALLALADLAAAIL